MARREVRELQQAERLFRSGDGPAAEKLLKRVLAVLPESAKANELMAYVVANRGDLEAAFPFLQRATRAPDASAQSWYYLALWFQKNGRLEDALAAYDRAQAMSPDAFAFFYDKGTALDALGRYEEAAANYSRALALNPGHAESWSNRGAALHDLGRNAEALADFERALALRPEDAHTQWNASQARLALGDFEAGWRLYEYRFQSPGGQLARHAGIARWTGGESLQGKRILAWCEQGLGDTLMFCRYAPLLASRGAAVVCEVQAPLRELVASIEGITVVAKGDPVPDCDFQIPLMSLPHAFATTRETIPASTPYLKADPARLRAMAARFARRARPNIGIACSGNAAMKHDARRSIVLREFAPLADAANVYLLQKTLTEADQAFLRQGGGGIEHLALDFNDTAAAIACLDLVVSVDTSIAHLAGALGRPVWILLSTPSDWRWTDEGTSPWYPTATLLRQARPGDWAEVMARVLGRARLEFP